MTNIEWFNFENNDLDFPLYKENPPISKRAWIVLFVAFLMGYIFSSFSSIPAGIFACVVLIVPLLYYLKWDYKALFQKPRLKDVAIAIGLFLGYMIYVVIMGNVLDIFHLSGAMESVTFTLMDIPPLIFLLMGEELVKLLPFLFFLRVFYKYTDNRKWSIVVSVFIIMVMFALMHSFDLRTFIFALFIQGFGSIFEFIGYIKTKNVLISYITHLCTDVFIIILSVVGF